MQLETKTSSARSQESNDGRRILILVLGNMLLKDEGIGVHIAGQLLKQNLPGNVEVIDGGTGSLDILLSRKGLHKLVVIDALKGGKKPGTIYKARFKAEQRNDLKKIFSRAEHSKISLHQVGLLDALMAAEKIDCLPDEIVIIGVEPKEMDCGLELTQPVKERIPEVIKNVLEETEDDLHRG